MLDAAAQDKVERLWGSSSAAQWRTSKCLHWTEHPRVQRRLNVLVSGDPHRDRFQYFIDTYYRRRWRPRRQVQRVLTLGCGHGEFERGFSQYGFARIHEGIDLAPGAIDEARRIAESAGLRNLQYRVADLNKVQLPKLAYDVVFGISSIHHVAALEHLFEQVAMSLRPGGYFLLDEYIGPDKFQWPDEQIAVVNEQIGVLPARLRQSIVDGTSKSDIGRASVEAMDAVDPSEAVRSSDILRVLPLYFDIVDFKGCGGSLLHLLLEGIAGNFAEDDAAATACLESLFRLEDELIAAGKLQHDFAVIVARRKPTRAQRLAGPQIAYMVSKARERFRSRP
jgi:SAM-dependent methyltransferase